jgi:transcriptional regulator with XRE-family HTH domain
MQIITPAQCRAARALLNWSQPELAERCDIHVQTISNFEKESSTPSKKTLEKIVIVIESAGIQLIDDDGVKRRQEIITQYRGVEGFRLFMDDVYETAKSQGGEICLLNAKPDNWIKWLGQDLWDFHADRMSKLSKTISAKITCPEGDFNFISKRFAEYRWVPKEIWNQHSFYAYGDKVAFLNFQKDDVRIFVLKHLPFAKTHKFLFNLVWEHHTMIPDIKKQSQKK